MTANWQNFDNDNPEVITFPPVIFATFFIMGAITDRALSHTLNFDGFHHPSGWALIVIGLLLVGWASNHFVGAKTPINVRKPTTTVVTDGPYKFSRNPMYVAATMVYAGLAVAFGKSVTLVFFDSVSDNSALRRNRTRRILSQS